MTVALWMVAMATFLSSIGASGGEAELHLDAFASPVYRRLARVESDSVVPFVVALRSADFGALERRLWSVSDPRHAEYGRHLTQEQVDALAAPQDGALQTVRDWLAPFVSADNHAEIGSFSSTTNMLKVRMSARRLEELLQTELHVFEAASRPGQRLLRASSAIVLPQRVQDVVAFVNINTAPLHLRSLSATGAAREATVDAAGASALRASSRDTLSDIRRSYGIPDGLVGTNASNSQALPSFYHESWASADLNSFYKKFLPEDTLPSIKFLPEDTLPSIVAKGDRQNDEHRASIEASLDVQYLTGVARNVTTYVWTMAGHNPFSTEDEPFVAFAEDVLAQANPPLVVSISYSDDEEHIFQASAGYARSFDTLLIKMGLRGISVLVASGDDGVAGLRPEFAKLPPSETCRKHGPQWPSSSPYITSVGATMRLSDQDFSKAFFRTNEEVICSGEMGGMITTGGGFSNVYALSVL
ncbi:hypothetical protein ATCC90586_008046 [Pythium insidiosum]|nr:hypothetical protein ATCC90586_008046 [Pythium insidiosum]